LSETKNLIRKKASAESAARLGGKRPKQVKQATINPNYKN